jgi:hypothetical protein
LNITAKSAVTATSDGTRSTPLRSSDGIGPQPSAYATIALTATLISSDTSRVKPMRITASESTLAGRRQTGGMP